MGRTLDFVVPGDIDARTGGYAYDREIIAGLRALGWHVEVHALHASFPFPSIEASNEARSTFSALPAGSIVMVDGLAFGAMPEIAEGEKQRLRLVALVHHPLALETGMSVQDRSDLFASEKRALATTRAIVVTSRPTARTLADYAVPESHVTVIEPGTAPAAVAEGSRSPALALLCVATLTARKGHDVLFAALSGLRSRDWHLTLVGGEPEGSGVALRMRARLEALGLEGRVTFTGPGDDGAVAAAYAAADVFVLPTLYEGYGMVVAEALARGLPVISTHTGAIPDLVEDAGLIVPPGDVAALAAALQRVMNEKELLSRLRERALDIRERLPRWPDSCTRLSALLDRVASA